MTNIQKIFLLILIVFLSFIFLNYFSVSLSNLVYPYDVEQAEGFMLPRIKFLLTGHPEYLYNSIYSYPYYFTNDYPPAFYFITAFLSLIFGEGFFAGRLFALLSSLLIGFFIFKIVKMKTKNAYLGLMAALFFFSSYVIFYWGSIYRVDVTGALFSLVGVYFFLMYKKNKTDRKNKYFILSILFFILAVTTKQSYIIAPLSSFFYLFLIDKRESFRFLLLFIVPTISIFLLLNFLTDGQFFLHTMVYNSKLLISQNSTDLINNLITVNFIILAISFLYFIREKMELISIYFLFSLLFALFQVFKTGSATNYFIEPVITMSIILGFCFDMLKRKKEIFNLLILLIFIQLYIYFYFNNQIFLSIFNPQKYFATRNLESDLKVLSYIKNSTGKVFIQNSMYSIANKGDVLFELWGIYDIPEKYINITRFEDYFKDQNYFLIFTNEHFSVFKNLYVYVENNYEPIDEISWYDNDYKYFPLYLYRLKPLGD